MSRCCCSRTAILTSGTKYSLAAFEAMAEASGSTYGRARWHLRRAKQSLERATSLCFGQPSKPPSPPSILAGDFAPSLRSRCCVALFLQLHRSSPRRASSPKLTSTSVVRPQSLCSASSTLWRCPTCKQHPPCRHIRASSVAPLLGPHPTPAASLALFRVHIVSAQDKCVAAGHERRVFFPPTA